MSAALKYEVIDYGDQGVGPAFQPTELAKPLELGHPPIFAELLEQLNASPAGDTAEEIAFDQKVNTLVTSSLTLRNTTKQTPMNNEPMTQNTDASTYPVRIYPATYDNTPVESSGPVKVDAQMHGVWQHQPFQPIQVDSSTHGVWTGAPTHTALHDHRSMSGLNMARTVHDSQETRPLEAVTQPINIEETLQFETSPAPIPNSPRAERALRLRDWKRGGETTRNQIDTRKADKIRNALALVEAATTELTPVPSPDATPTQASGTEPAIKKTTTLQAVAPEQSQKIQSLPEPINRIEQAHQPGLVRRALRATWGFVWKRRIPGLK